MNRFVFIEKKNNIIISFRRFSRQIYQKVVMSQIKWFLSKYPTRNYHENYTYREGHSLTNVVLIDHPQHGADLFPAIFSLRDVPSVISGPSH